MRATFDRRGFLKTCAGAGAGLTASLAGFHTLAAAERKKVKIVDIKTMVIQGPRTYTYVKVITDAGLYGLGEAYGSPAVGVPESIAAMKEHFVGKDPLSIESLLVGLGNRFDGSAHMLLRGISGIEMALWDLAGKILDVPTTVLLGGPFRKTMRMYTGQGPRNMLDKASCRDWIGEMKGSKAGWTAFKLGPPGGFGGGDGERPARPRQSPAQQEPPNGFIRAAQGNRVYGRKQLIDIQQGFENVREAIGWERDVMFHGQWNFDLLAAIQLSQALETVKPLWIEDPMPPEFSNAWVRLTETSKVPILTGENLGRRQDWVPFFEQKGIHIAQLDVRNTGGLLESKKIADLADVHLIPMCAHDTASIVCNYGVLHWACAVRDFIAAETRIGNGDWMDDIILHDGPVIKDSHMTLPEKAGLGIELNPDVVKAHLAPGQAWWG